jgi:hypothetical protein
MDKGHHVHNKVDHQKKYVDPVCGMSTEDAQDFIQHNYAGTVYSFCGEHCFPGQLMQLN